MYGESSLDGGSPIIGGNSIYRNIEITGNEDLSGHEGGYRCAGIALLGSKSNLIANVHIHNNRWLSKFYASDRYQNVGIRISASNGQNVIFYLVSTILASFPARLNNFSERVCHPENINHSKPRYPPGSGVPA